MFSRELNNANTVKRMVDFLGHHLRIMKKIILILAAMQLSPSTREGLSPHPHRERLYPPKLPRRSPGGIRFVAV